MCRKVYIKPLVHELLKDLESEIKKIVGTDVCSFTQGHTKYDAKYKKIKELLYVRQTLLNELFFAASEEFIRLKQVNSLQDELTKKMFHRTVSLYRALLSSYRDKEFDDDYDKNEKFRDKLFNIQLANSHRFYDEQLTLEKASDIAEFLTHVSPDTLDGFLSHYFIH